MVILQLKDIRNMVTIAHIWQRAIQMVGRSLSQGLVIGVWVVAIALTGCTAPAGPPPESPPLQTITLDDATAIAAGQTVYVPVYSYIYMMEQGRTMNLTATLSVRNTDRQHPLIITAVDYYSSTGELVRNYLEQPVQLPKLAATDFVVAQEDISGGLGSSFIVQWVAEQVVSPPVIEAIMINTSGNQGLSFVSAGHVIRDRPES